MKLSSGAIDLWWLIDSYEAMTISELTEFEDNDRTSVETDEDLYELIQYDLVRETDGHWDIHCSETTNLYLPTKNPSRSIFRMNRKEALKILEEVLLLEKEELARRLEADANPLVAARPEETNTQRIKVMKLGMAYYYFKDRS